MSYTVNIHGRFRIDKPLAGAQVEYLQQFSKTERIARHTMVTQATYCIENQPDPVRNMLGLPVGTEGAYYVGGNAKICRRHSPSQPPKGQPSDYCCWTVSNDGKWLEYDTANAPIYSFHSEWLTYLIDHFMRRWGRKIHGKVQWQGENPTDTGVIEITSNGVAVHKGRMLADVKLKPASPVKPKPVKVKKQVLTSYLKENPYIHLTNEELGRKWVEANKKAPVYYQGLWYWLCLSGPESAVPYTKEEKACHLPPLLADEELLTGFLDQFGSYGFIGKKLRMLQAFTEMAQQSILSDEPKASKSRAKPKKLVP